MIAADGRVVMISGPVRGIGRSVAERLRTAGFTLSLGGRSVDAIDDMIREWPSNAASGGRDTAEGGRDTAEGSRDSASAAPAATAHAFDAFEADSARRWVAETVEQHGGIDVVINNAGLLEGFGLDDYDESAFDAMLQVNVKAPTLLTHLTLPHLSVSGHGRVINIASLSGKRVKGGFSPGYAMSKHAVMALTHATRQHGWDAGIRATAICPSFVGTDMIAHVDTGEEPVTHPDDIAELVNTALMMPNNASVPEILVNCRKEDLF